MKYKLKVCSVAAAALALVAVTPLEASATFPGHNGRIIFHRGSPDPCQSRTHRVCQGRRTGIFLVSMEPDGSDATRLARDSNAASWAPDGSRFIYSNGSDLFLRNADGSNRTQVTPSDGLTGNQVAFGPDGNQAVYQKCGFSVGDDQCDLFIIDLTTSIETRLTDSRAHEFAPEWSVDDVIVYDRSPRRGDDEIFTIHPDGTARTRLTNNRRLHDGYPSWSPDGTKIVYHRCVREDSGCDLFTMDPDGSHKVRITDTRADESGAKFSPNGRYIVFIRSPA
jgi:Tol biopolymer transport system component